MFTEKELTRSTTRLRSVALSLNPAQQSRCSGFSPILVAIILLLLLTIIIIITINHHHRVAQLAAGRQAACEEMAS